MERPSHLNPHLRNPYSYHRNRYYLSEAAKTGIEASSMMTEHINQSIQMLLQYKLYRINRNGQEEQLK